MSAGCQVCPTGTCSMEAATSISRPTSSGARVNSRSPASTTTGRRVASASWRRSSVWAAAGLSPPTSIPATVVARGQPVAGQDVAGDVDAADEGEHPQRQPEQDPPVTTPPALLPLLVPSVVGRPRR